MIGEDELRRKMIDIGVWSDSGHYAYSSGRHGNTFFDKYGLSVNTRVMKDVGVAMALAALDWNPDIVLSPAYSGIALTQWTADKLSVELQKRVLALYVVKSVQPANNKFAFTANLGCYVSGKRAVILEDNINTGESIHELSKLVESNGGQVVGAVTIMNRGNVQLSTDFPIVTLLTSSIDSWEKGSCLLCPAPLDGHPVRK